MPDDAFNVLLEDLGRASRHNDDNAQIERRSSFSAISVAMLDGAVSEAQAAQAAAEGPLREPSHMSRDTISHKFSRGLTLLLKIKDSRPMSSTLPLRFVGRVADPAMLVFVGTPQPSVGQRIRALGSQGNGFLVVEVVEHEQLPQGRDWHSQSFGIKLKYNEIPWPADTPIQVV